MEQGKYRLGAVVGLIFYATQGILIVLSELPLIPESQRFSYVLGKVFLLATAFLLAYWLWRDYESVAANTLIGLHFMLYTFQGQWYRPLYYFSFCQLAVAYSFIFAVPKRIFRPILLVWLLVYSYVFHLTWEKHQLALQNPVFSDIIFCISATAMIALIAHSYFTSSRMFREVALARFSRVAFGSARLIHDVKGLMGAPVLYAQLLQKELKGTANPLVTEALSSLSKDLENLQRVVLELNQMSAVRSNNAPTEFNFEKIISGVRLMMGDRLMNVNFENSVNLKLRGDLSLVTSVVLNIFLNSLDSFKHHGIAKPVIKASSDGRSLKFTDNGLGFDPAVLKALANQKVLSTKESGSGVGLFVIMDAMESLGGKALFQNVDRHAQVELIFPKKSVVPA